jgi:hypothetical protein
MGAGKNSSTVNGAVVTAVQGNTKITQTTDQTGIVTFTGLFKGAIAVTISKDEYTGVSYIATANNIIKRDSTNKNQKTKVYVTNQIPVFKYKNDPSTAKLIGRATYENDLTNTTREFVPENTVVRAYIDASDILFQTTYLKTKVTTADIYGGEILQIAYSSFFYDSTDAQGNYEIIVPSAIAGLPFIVTAGDIVGTQKVFENTAGIRIQKENDTSSWFGFGFVLEGHLRGLRKQVTDILIKNQVECRPIVAGNFLRNPVIKHLSYINTGTTAADLLHDNGFFIGNDCVDLTAEINYAAELIKDIK